LLDNTSRQIEQFVSGVLGRSGGLRSGSMLLFSKIQSLSSDDKSTTLVDSLTPSSSVLTLKAMANHKLLNLKI